MTVHAAVRYLKPEWKGRDERAFIYSKETRHENTAKYTVAIHDARALVANGEITVAQNGIAFAEHPVRITDYGDEEAVRRDYAETMVPTLLEATGGKEAFMVGHQVRTEDPKTFLGAYSRYVHCDYPLRRTHERERNLLKERGSPLADDIENVDYAWFNIWEAIERPAEQNQLTIIDAATTEADDFEEYLFTSDPKGGFAAIPLMNPNHRFLYFSKMQPGESVIFKQLDSRADKPLVCPHTAFYDPAIGEDHAGRRSVEYRALVIF